MLLPVDCRIAEVTIKKSLIMHLHAGLRIFAPKPFMQGTDIVHYNASLLHLDLTSRKLTKMWYGEHLMEVTRDGFQNWVSRQR